MPMYDYKCAEHGYFPRKQAMKDHARADCPTCGSDSKQVLLSAPSLDTEAMADAGCPSAFFKSGDRMTKRNQAAGQYNNTPSQYWRDQ